MTLTVFYILSGKDYIEEARCSAESVRHHMPYVRRELFTPDENVEPGTAFDGVNPLPPRIHTMWYLDSIRYLMLALRFLPEYLIWLDGDTYCCMRFGEMFDMLDRFDLIAAHAPARRTGLVNSLIPRCFSELNIGVVGLHNTERLWAFVERWYLQHVQHAEIYGNNDQNSLKEALWLDKELRWYVLPPEWNQRLVSPDGYFLCDKVRFLHGRHPNMEKLAESANRGEGMRVWKPE